MAMCRVSGVVLCCSAPHVDLDRRALRTPVVGWRAAEGADDPKVIVELSDASAAKNAKVVGTAGTTSQRTTALSYTTAVTTPLHAPRSSHPLSRSCEGRKSAELTSLCSTGAWRRRCGASAVWNLEQAACQCCLSTRRVLEEPRNTGVVSFSLRKLETLSAPLHSRGSCLLSLFLSLLVPLVLSPSSSSLCLSLCLFSFSLSPVPSSRSSYDRPMSDGRNTSHERVS